MKDSFMDGLSSNPLDAEPKPSPGVTPLSNGDLEVALDDSDAGSPSSFSDEFDANLAEDLSKSKLSLRFGKSG